MPDFSMKNQAFAFYNSFTRYSLLATYSTTLNILISTR